MEKDKSESTIPRNASHSLFQKEMFSLVTYEIWRDLIVSNADPHSIILLGQTSHGFEKLVDDLGKKNMNLALSLRREGQISLALKYLRKCADHGNANAIFYLGKAHFDSSWGVERDKLEGEHNEIAAALFKKSAELGHPPSMIFYAYSLKNRLATESDPTSAQIWTRKALSSRNSFVLGMAHFWGLGKSHDRDKTFAYLELSATEGDEFAQHFLPFACLGYVKKTKKALLWRMKSAEQGNSEAQHYIGDLFLNGYDDMPQDKEMAISWFKKAAKQGNQNSKNALDGI